MEIINCYNSGFIIRENRVVLMIDCIEEKVFEFINPKDKVYVLFSHSHSDHYNKNLYDFTSSQFQYIVSDDITNLIPRDNIHFVKPYERLLLEDLDVITYGSTDLGVSFAIKFQGKILFHAGDLNWWHWESDTKEQQLREEKIYTEEISKIEELSIDIAFLPVDPRLNSAFYYGANYFIETVAPKKVFPMHFRDEFSIPRRLIEKLGTPASQVVDLKKLYEKYVL